MLPFYSPMSTLLLMQTLNLKKDVLYVPMEVHPDAVAARLKYLREGK